MFVPEQVSTGSYDWLKATGDEMGTIEGISCVWNHTHDVSMDACYADENVPIVLNDVPIMLNVYGNEHEWVTLTAR